VLVISIDTLRRDVLKVYDQAIPMQITPNLDRWARKGVVLDECYVPSPRTSQSLAAFFTGRTPTHNGVFGIYHELPESETTLAEILAEQGYRTSAVVTNAFLKSGRGFDQGFEVYDDFLYRSKIEYAEDVADRVERFTLDTSTDDPYLMWVHFLDPHWRYDPPAEITQRLHPGYREPFTLFADLDSSLVTGGEITFENDMDPELRRHLRRRYLGEIHYLDGHIGRMLGILEARGLLENTIIVFYSDHGESLGEHDYYYAHGERLYQPSVHIPAAIVVPGGIEGSRYRGLVSAEDFLPTILELAGLPRPDGLDGHSFAGAMVGNAPVPRSEVYLESDYQLIHPENPEMLRAVVAEGFKLIQVPLETGERFELYDLANDPQELQDLAGLRPDVLERLRAVLGAHNTAVDGQEGLPVPVDEESDERLRSRGYIN
jgi:arylsulfatase A-like enzyme